jgi:hypothetical protein
MLLREARAFHAIEDDSTGLTHHQLKRGGRLPRTQRRASNVALAASPGDNSGALVHNRKARAQTEPTPGARSGSLVAGPGFSHEGYLDDLYRQAAHTARDPVASEKPSWRRGTWGSVRPPTGHTAPTPDRETCAISAAKDFQAKITRKSKQIKR